MGARGPRDDATGAAPIRATNGAGEVGPIAGSECATRETAAASAAAGYTPSGDRAPPWASDAMPGGSASAA